MPRLIPLERLRDPDEPNPYEGYQSGFRSEPPYDTLVVGFGTRQAFRGGVLVNERTGEPLPTSPPLVENLPPPRRRRGRPPDVRKEGA